jgi:hypothetical protein
MINSIIYSLGIEKKKRKKIRRKLKLLELSPLILNVMGMEVIKIIKKEEDIPKKWNLLLIMMLILIIAIWEQSTII